MQFKRVKGRIQVIAYRGYDKERRHAVTKMLGSLDRFTFEPTVGLLDSLTVEETVELQLYIEKVRQSDRMNDRQYGIDDADSRMIELADSIGDERCTVSAEKAAQIWAALTLVQRALKARGHKRPKDDSRSEPVPDSRQSTLPV